MAFQLKKEKGVRKLRLIGLFDFIWGKISKISSIRGPESSLQENVQSFPCNKKIDK